MMTLKLIAYEKYRLDWMAGHGYTINDLISVLADYMVDTEESLMETYWMWQNDGGFGGELWVCYDEFLDYEYKDIDYMRKILDDCEFEQYCREEIK